MPKKENKKQEATYDGLIVAIMIMTLAMLFFFVVFWRQSLGEMFSPRQSHWRTVDQVQISPRD